MKYTVPRSCYGRSMLTPQRTVLVSKSIKPTSEYAAPRPSAVSKVSMLI